MNRQAIEIRQRMYARNDSVIALACRYYIITREENTGSIDGSSIVVGLVGRRSSTRSRLSPSIRTKLRTGTKTKLKTTTKM